MPRSIVVPSFVLCLVLAPLSLHAVENASPLSEKARYFQQDLLDKHWLDGLYISIVPAAPEGTKLDHTVNEPGNVIHAGVWTGRYLAGVGYQYAVTGDSKVREHGGQILKALRILQEVTGKPGEYGEWYYWISIMGTPSLDQPWGWREFALKDPDGYVWSIYQDKSDGQWV